MGLEADTIEYGNKKTILDAAVRAEGSVVIADAVTKYVADAKTIGDLIADDVKLSSPLNTIPISSVNTFLTAANTFKDAIKNTVITNAAIVAYSTAADNIIATIIAEVGTSVSTDTAYNTIKKQLLDNVAKYKTTVTTTTNNILTYVNAADTIGRLIAADAKLSSPLNTIPISSVNTFLTAADTLKDTAAGAVAVAAADGSVPDVPVTRATIISELTDYSNATIAYIENIISDKIAAKDKTIAERDKTIAEKDSKINSADNTNNKLIAIKDAINELESKTMINDRVGHNFIQDKVVSQYTNNILFFLYYVIFILFAVSLYLNRESYSTFLIVIILLIFGVLPFIIKYITNFAYNRFLDIAHIFYNGNARYLGPKAMPQ